MPVTIVPSGNTLLMKDPHVPHEILNLFAADSYLTRASSPLVYLNCAGGHAATLAASPP